MIPNPIDFAPEPTTPNSLADLSVLEASLLQRIAANPNTPVDPHNIGERRAVMHLYRFGFVSGDLVADTFTATPDGLRWLEFFGPDESAPTTTTTADLASPSSTLTLAAPLLASLERYASTAKVSVTEALHDLLRKALDDVSTPVITGSPIVRAVNDLVVWSDVTRACKIPNSTQYARMRRIKLVELPPSVSSTLATQGRPPRYGIAISDLDTIECDYPLEISEVRKALVSVLAPTAPAEPTPPTPAHIGVFYIRNKSNTDVFVGGSLNIERQWNTIRAAIARGQHRYLKGSVDDFTFEIAREFPHTVTHMILKKATTDAIFALAREHANVLNAQEIMFGKKAIQNP